MTLRPFSVTPATLRLCVGLGAGLAIAGTMAVAALFVVSSRSEVPELVELPPCERSCTIPDGIDFSALSPRDRSYLARRAVLCADLACGRIDGSDYRDSLAKLDVEPEPEPEACVAPPEPVWASHVLGVSSQYTANSWSASQVVGPPNVYPRAGDDANAWAPLAQDGGTEFIELGFAQGRRVGGVRIAETYNAGAVTQVELITAAGARRVVFQGPPEAAAGARLRDLAFTCTDEPIVGVRLTLNTAAVPGWNEIDAVGLLPCQ